MYLSVYLRDGLDCPFIIFPSLIAAMLTLTVLLLPLLSAASLHHHRGHDHSHNAARRLPSTWYHRSDHPVHSLFKRGGATDGITYAAVGSPEWQNAYPPGPPASPDVNAMPAEWTAALNDAVARGAIPDIPVATDVTDQNPVYPTGVDPNSPQICSATYKCRIDGDIWDAPEGYVGISFDDGPTDASDALLSFLKTNNQHVTHFMIGSNIIYNPKQFQTAFDQGGDIAVHTWTHPHMTTRSNLEVLAELGWTIEVIHNSTGGRIPKFWRPPYGDSDARVTAIAREVFGLTTVIWNQDTEDWSLTSGGTTAEAISKSMSEWLTGPKNPGLIILEHELSDQSVASFVAAYPVMQANNWNLVSLAQLVGNNASYQNAADNVGAVVAANVFDPKGAASSAGGASSGVVSSGGASSSSPARVSGSNTQKVAAQATSVKTSATGSADPSTSSNAASSGWAQGPTGMLAAAAVLFMLRT
ncbi:carbohydrate esterase family 4 protein [Mycena vulgaris]|nr:carbohydrate esterase family 4 protein [Mycena vulgaris]